MRAVPIYLSIFAGAVFFVAALLTLPHYGINWDTINHLPRGQAYLNYFLTGKKDFADLPPFRWYWQRPESLGIDADIPREEIPPRSLYQNDATTFSWFMEHDGGGHPPLSDILSSVFNLILFQKLGLINDIDSYRVYGLFLAASLVGLVFWWTSQNYGRFAGLVAALSLAIYPLFWSESHFNGEKDIPEAVFWSFLLFSIWKAISGKSWKWMLASGVFFGLALGTKFNVLFSAFVILPWVVFFLWPKAGKRLPIKLIVASFISPLIGVGIFILSWPYLWQDIIAGIGGVFNFYRTLGFTQDVDVRFVGPFGINTYPLTWIFYTTPVFTLLLALVGIIRALGQTKSGENKTSLLFLLWLVVPIARVTWPGTTIYGGVRQIMEFIPALAILTGLGGAFFLESITRVTRKFGLSKIFVGLLILVAFVPNLLELIKIHPNENVYFSELIGGLSGAKEKDIPAWGNSFGAAYRQGAIWLNKNAEPGARIAYARELIPNIPRIWLRQDMVLHNGNRSGYLRKGEYIIALTYQGTNETSYFDRYLDRFLVPVYAVRVDGIPILQVWKNDKDHTKPEYLNERQFLDFSVAKTGFGLRFDLETSVNLLYIKGEFDGTHCSVLESGYVEVSRDNLVWKRLPGTMPKEDWSVPQFGNQPQNGQVLIPFAADKVRYVNLVIKPSDACLLNLKNIQVRIVELER